MAPSHSVAVFGATGLVGRECLKLLLERPEFSRVVVGVRRPLSLELSAAQRSKLEVHVIDFDHLERHPSLFAVDQVLCALGTTIRKAGSQSAFRTVDFTYQERVAKLGAAGGASHFLLVSSLGADPRASVFYSRVKGEIEQAVLALPYRAHTIVRPSLLLGEREEFRFGEKLAERFAFLAPRKYKPVHVRDVARALVSAAAVDRPGVQIIESRDL